MDTRSWMLPVVLTTGLPLSGQYMVNPYQDLDGQVFQVPVPLNCGGNCNNYVGEYQIFLSDGHWNLGEQDRYATYRIEVVSFPFTPPPVPLDTVLRPMVMPDLASYGYTSEGYGCTGWAWNSTNQYLTEPTRTLMREVRGDFTGSEGGGSAWMSDYQVPASEQMIAGGAPGTCGDLGNEACYRIQC